MTAQRRFKAYRIHEENRKIVARFESLTLDDLTAGEVVVRVTHSGINYKDALAATGAGRILRRYPLVGGIDFIAAMIGLFAIARVSGDAVIPLPPGLDALGAMTIGTAGFTAALAIHRMEHNGQTPAKGPIVVTGATGGVGSLAIDMLARRGYEVVAVSGKAQHAEYLRALGAATVLARQEIDYGSKPLEAERFAGAIDNVGGEMLTWLTRTVGYWGNIASVGLAGSPKLETTVVPFILRGVNLLGINSSATPREPRLAVWQRIAADLAPRHLDRIRARTIRFDELPGAFGALLEGGMVGRTVVAIG